MTLSMGGRGGWDTYLHLLAGPCDALAHVASNDDAQGISGSVVEVLDLPAGEYVVVATGYSSDAIGELELTARFFEPVVCGDGVCADDHETWRTCRGDCEAPPPPDNDRCEGAEPIPAVGLQTVQGSTEVASIDYVAALGPDVWYGLTLDAAASVTAVVEADGGWDTFLFLLAGPCGAAVEVARNDDWERVGVSRIVEGALAPGEYLLVVAGYDEDAAGPFTLTIELAPAEEVP